MNNGSGWILVLRMAGGVMALATGLSIWRAKPMQRYPRRIVRQPPREPQESDQYPALQNLVGGYFHQDWDYETDDPDEVLATFRDESHPQHVQNTIHDMERFRSIYGEDDLESAFVRVFNPEAYFYDLDRMTVREGFRHAIEILSTPRKGNGTERKP